MGNACSIVTKALFQALIILIVGVLMGAKLSGNPLSWLGGLILIAGYGLGFSGIALALASKTDSSGAYHMMIFMLNLPLLFLSNALYPLQTLPTWMQIGAYINPTTYVVSGLRQTTLATGPDMSGGETISLWLSFLVVAVFAVLGMGLALKAFKSAIK
jgi:ABC-2 type transport system permease protein